MMNIRGNTALKPAASTPSMIRLTRSKKQKTSFLQRLIVFVIVLSAVVVSSQYALAMRQDRELEQMRARLEAVELRTQEMQERFGLTPGL